MGRSKFPGKPSKHVNRKRINVLPATSDTIIECSQSLTVETTAENKQELSECMENDEDNLKNTVNISKVSLRKRLNRKLQNSKNVLNTSSSKRNLISKICNKTNNRTINNKSSRQTNINRKSLHGYSMKTINKQQRKNKNTVPKETNNSIVGKFVLPTRSVHSSRVIKPNKRFINVDLNDTLPFKKKTVNNKKSCEKSDDDCKQPSSDNKNNSISDQTSSSSTPNTNSTITSTTTINTASITPSTSSNNGINITTNTSTTSPTKPLPNGRIVLRQARLKLHTQTTISNSDGPFSSNITNNSPPGTVTCGVCGAVRFYRFVKQARKFNIYSCESCRKFISKMIKRQNCGKNTSSNILVCHEGQGMCHVPPVVRNQQMKVVRCGYKARCPACWLKMCLRSFQMPLSLKHSLAQLLPKYMQGSDVMFSNSLPLLWQMSNKNLNNPITNDIKNNNDNIKQRPVRLKSNTSTSTTTTKSTTLQSLQISNDIKRQKIDLKGPRVKHVCRSASIVLGQPQATFPIDIDKNKIDNKEQIDNNKRQKIETKSNNSEETKTSIKINKNEQISSENELSDSDKNSTKLQDIIDNNAISFKRDKLKFIDNKLQTEKKRIRPEIQSNMVYFDYYDNYDLDDINHNGLCLISSQQFLVNGVCFLCGSGGRETLLYCSLCCEPYHPYCLEQLPLINNNNNNRQFIWLCPKCTKCTFCNQPDRQKINCQMCSKTYHPECLDAKRNGNNHRPNVCFECLTCKNCKNQITNLNGNLPFCSACLKIRKESNICTLCLNIFKEDVDELIMECTNCHKWVHVKCEGLSEEYYQILTLLPEKLRYICRLCSKEITPYWRKLVDAELNFNFNQVIRLLIKNKIARNILKLNPINKQKRMKKLQCDDNDIDSVDEIDDIDDGVSNVENNINNDNNNKNSQIQCNYDENINNNILTIQNIRNKLNSNQYSSLKEFDSDMEEVLNKINSIDLIKIYRSILNSIFPWYNKQSKSLLDGKFPIQKQHILTDTTITFDNSCTQIDNNIMDTRYCQLCRNLGDGYSESRLLYCGQNEWVHANCALWSDEVYEEIDGSLQNVYDAINRGRITRCTYCKQKGATLSCCYKNCMEIYHFICAKNSNCTFMNDKKIYCLYHLQLFKTNNQTTNFQLSRTMFVELNNDKEKYYPIDKVNVMIGSLRVINLGKINPLVSDNVDVLIPTGYVCTRLYWSTVEPWKLVNYKITTSVINCNTNNSHIERNFTIDHTLSRSIVERKLKEVYVWQKDIDRKRTDIINDFDDDDEPQNGAADLLSPEITDAIFEELPHELLDGISVQDIFPKLMTNYEDFVTNDTGNKLIDNSNNDNNDNENFNDFNDNKNQQRSCSLTLSCKLDNTFSPAIKKRKIAPPRENNLFFQLLQVDGTFDDSGSSDCESPTDNIDDTIITTPAVTNIWSNNIEEPVTCGRCHCTYRTKASYKRHLDSCELICSSESDSELNQEQDNCINIDTTLQNSHLNIMEKCSTVVINETTQQPVVLTSSFESYQNEIHTAVLNTHQTFVSSKSAELITTVPQCNNNTITNNINSNNTNGITTANNSNNNIFVSPITQTSVDSNNQQHNDGFTTVNRCPTLSVNESVPIQNNQFCLNQTTVPICVNPTSLSLQANSTVSVNSPLINQNNQILNQTQLEYQPSVTIQPVCYSNNLQPIINVAPQNQINFTNNKLITSNSFVTQGININNTTINMSQSNRWTKPVGKPAVFTKSQQKLKNPKGRTIIAKRPIDDNDNTIIIPTTSSISTASLTLTSTTSSSVSPISSSSAPSPSSSSSSTSQPTMIVQHLPSTTNFIPTFVDTFPHHQNNQNLQYLTTITTPQISPQPLVQLQTDNNIISLLPGMQPTTMIIQQQPPRILENQLVLDSNGSLSWAPQQITQPIYYGFETIVQNTIMQSQQFLPTTVPGVLTANSSYSTTTQVFQTSKLEPVIADVSTNNFVLLNPGQLMNQSIQVSQNTTQHYQQPQINNNNNNNLNSIIQNKNIITTTATTVPTTTIITTTSTTPTTTTRLTSCPVKYSNANNNSNINNNTNNNNNIILQKSDKQTTQSYTNSNNNTNITLPTSPFISELGIPTNIVTPTPKLHHIVNNNNNNNSNNNNNNNNNNNISNNTNQNRPMSRVLPMQNIKETNSINIGSKNNANHNHNHNNNYNNNINNSIINNNNHHQMDDGDDNNNHNNNNNSNNNNNNNNGDISKNINDKTDIANNLMKDIKTVEIEIRTVDKIDDNEEKILLNDDKQMKIDDDNTKSEPIKMIFHKQTEDGTYKISNLFDKTNTIDDGKLDNFVTKFNDNCTTTTITTTTATVTNNNINNSCNSPENTFKLSNFTKNSPVAPLKPIKSNYTSPILPLGDKLQNCSSIDIIDKKDILSRKQKQPPLQQQQDKKDENSPTILYTIETQDGFKYSSTSLSDMWTKLFETVQNARIANNMPPLPSYYNNMNNNIKLLGLKSPSLKYLIEQLPGVNKCTKYKPTYNFASKLNDIDDEPIGHNYGCVRCLPHIKSNNNNYDMFGWLASRHRRPEPNLNCTDLVPRRSSINNLPMAMRFRQLKLTSKYSVGVYRSKIHRRGLFCLRDFEAGEMVIEYSGEVIRSVLTDKREKYYNSKGIGCYMFRIDDNLVVDATMKGNAARFINHSCDPNCYSKVVEILGHKHIIIFALRRIICGEELTYDYKFPIEEDKIPCTCGTKKCRKFLN